MSLTNLSSRISVSSNKLLLPHLHRAHSTTFNQVQVERMKERETNGKQFLENSTTQNTSEDSENSDKIMPSQNTLLCFDISHLTNRAQFILCSVGVFIFFVLYGFMQELIFTLEVFKPYGWYLTLIQFCYYTVFGLCEIALRNDRVRRIPIKVYLFLAFLTVGTMGFSNASLGHLNYPTQVIFKCCKLIPVLIGSVIIQGKKYNALDYLASVMMCVGLIWFILADSKISPIFDTIGLVMISCALLCDAVIGNVQEKTIKKHNASNAEVVLYSYGIGVFYILLYEVVSGELFPAFVVCVKHPMETYGYACIFSLTGYIGIQIVLQLVKTGGAFAAVTVTTCRKAVTIVVSFLAFQKPFTIQYLFSGLLVVVGIYLNLYSKKHQSFSIIQWLKSIGSKPYYQRYKQFVQQV